MFKINLIKNKVLPFDKREKIFAGIILYLAFCGLILVSLCYKITANFVKQVAYQKQVATLENKFYQQHPQEKNIVRYAKVRKNKMLQYSKKLEAIDKVLSRSINLSRLMQRFSFPLSFATYINNFNLDSSAQVLSFDLIIPTDKIRGTFDTSRLISAWKEDARLMSDIKQIKSSISQRQKMGKRQVFISKFSCLLSNEKHR